MNPINILLSEDHMILRAGLRSLLADEDDIRIIGEAANGHQAVELCLHLQPHIVVMDIHMPRLNGLEATRQIMQARPATKILILSASSDPIHLEELMKLKISGYLLKQSEAELLPAAIRAAHKGEAYFSPSIARHLEREACSDAVHEPSCLTQLTSREAEVLQLVAEGSANKQISAELHISVKTVDKHRQSLMKKLRIHDIAGLTRYAIDRGIIDSEVRVAVTDLV
ncbi:MAG: response regulator transcription factor [Prosthecobacter sp.]|uniref:response regulator n=1 Tax=Prosthecobacter sp. TaxID=1965333 RepID=UPI003BAE409A